ncbi:hypothetical protein ACFFW8_09940 [Erwinia tracheiphila]
MATVPCESAPGGVVGLRRLAVVPPRALPLPTRSGRGATERRAAACGLSAARARRTRAGAAASCVPVTGCRVKSHQRERLMTGCGVGDMVNGRENACRESWVNVLLLL